METEGNYLSSFCFWLKGCCTLVKDRFKSLEKRGLVVPTAKTKTKRLVYELQDCILSSLWFLKCTCIFYISYSDWSFPVSRQAPYCPLLFKRVQIIWLVLLDRLWSLPLLLFAKFLCSLFQRFYASYIKCRCLIELICFVFLDRK